MERRPIVRIVTVAFRLTPDEASGTSRCPV